MATSSRVTLSRIGKLEGSLREKIDPRRREVLAELVTHARRGRSADELRAMSSALRSIAADGSPGKAELELLRSIWPELPKKLRSRLVNVARADIAIRKDPEPAILLEAIGAPVAGSSSPKKSKKRGGKRRKKKRVRAT